jgi:hypothetical protein
VGKGLRVLTRCVCLKNDKCPHLTNKALRKAYMRMYTAHI